MQQPRRRGAGEDGFNLKEIGSCAAGCFRRLEQDAQAFVGEAAPRERHGRGRVPDAGFYADAHVQQQLDDLRGAGFMKID